MHEERTGCSNQDVTLSRTEVAARSLRPSGLSAGVMGRVGGALTCKVDYTASSSSAQNITATYSGDATHYPSSDTFQLNGRHGDHEVGSSSTAAPSFPPLPFQLVPFAAIALVAFSGQVQLRALATKRARSVRLQRG